MDERYVTLYFFMHYNEVQSRLKSIYSSIGQRYEYDEMVLKRMYSEVKENVVRFSFYKDEEESEVLNQINIIIFNLANIKDCLKNFLNKRSEDDKVIESEIDESIYLQLVIDLANQEKHGYPLTKFRRSLKDPLITNIGRGITISNKKETSIVFGNEGAMSQNCMIVTSADIVDSNGNLLYSLDDLIDNAIITWEKVIKKYNIT